MFLSDDFEHENVSSLSYTLRVSDHIRLSTKYHANFSSIMAASSTVLDMVNAVYYDKPLIFISATFREKLVSHHQAVNKN